MSRCHRGAHSEAMTLIILVKIFNLPQDTSYLGHKLGLCQWCSIFKAEERPRGVASLRHICNNRCHWTQSVCHPTQEYDDTSAKLVAFRPLQVYADG